MVSQQREDGANHDRQYDTTMTALAIMALASTGNTPSTPSELGDVSRKALDFVLREDRRTKTATSVTKTDRECTGMAS